LSALLDNRSIASNNPSLDQTALDSSHFFFIFIFFYFLERVSCVLLYILSPSLWKTNRPYNLLGESSFAFIKTQHYKFFFLPSYFVIIESVHLNTASSPSSFPVQYTQCVDEILLLQSTGWKGSHLLVKELLGSGPDGRILPVIEGQEGGQEIA